MALRRRTGWGADRLGALLGLPAATCHRVLRRQGLCRAPGARAGRALRARASGWPRSTSTPRSWDASWAGPGTGPPATAAAQPAGVGWEVLHVALDDASRLVYAEILPDERGAPRPRFTVRAVRWFAGRA